MWNAAIQTWCSTYYGRRRHCLSTKDTRRWWNVASYQLAERRCHPICRVNKLYTYAVHDNGNIIFIDRVSGKGNAIGRVRPSVRPFVSTRIFSINCPFTSLLPKYMGHEHSSPGIKSEGHKVKVNVKLPVLHVHLLRRPVSIDDGRNSTFLMSHHQLRASAARRVAWRGRGQRHVGVVTR